MIKITDAGTTDHETSAAKAASMTPAPRCQMSSCSELAVIERWFHVVTPNDGGLEPAAYTVRSWLCEEHYNRLRTANGLREDRPTRND